MTALLSKLKASQVMRLASLPWPKRLVHSHMDAVSNGYITERLRYFAQQAFDIVRAPLFWEEFGKGCIDTSVPEGYRTFSYSQREAIGYAKAITNSSKDSPKVETLVKEFDQRFQAYGDAYSYSIFDLMADQVSGLPLEQFKSVAVRDVLDRTWDSIFNAGDSAFGLKGLFNNALHTSSNPGGIPLFGSNDGSVAAGYVTTGMTLDWLAAGTSPDEIIADINLAVAALLKSTKLAERGPWVLGVGTAIKQKLASTPRSETTDTTTEAFILGTNKRIASIEEHPYLDTAAADGGNRVMFFARDPMKGKFLLPVRFKQLPPQELGYDFTVNCYGVGGGWIFPYPRAHAYLDMGDSP
jgi:hypothetical protein